MSESQLVVCPVCARSTGFRLRRSVPRPIAEMWNAQPGQPADVDQAASDRHVGRGSLPVLVDFAPGGLQPGAWRRRSPPPPSWNRMNYC